MFMTENLKNLQKIQIHIIFSEGVEFLMVS